MIELQKLIDDLIKIQQSGVTKIRCNVQMNNDSAYRGDTNGDVSISVEDDVYFLDCSGEEDSDTGYWG